MGFFNFWYNLKFFLRRMPKKILVAICIFLIICITHLKGYCIEHVIVDNIPNYDVINYQTLRFQKDFNLLLQAEINYAKQHNNIFHNRFKSLCGYMWLPQLKFWCTSEYQQMYFPVALINQPSYIYYGFITTYSQGADETINFPQSPNTSSTVAFQIDADKWTNARYNYVYTDVNGNITTLDNWGTSDIIIPIGCDKMFTQYQIDCINMIANDTFDFASYTEILNNISQNIEEINDNLSDLNNYLQDDTISQYSQNDLPSDSMNDITANEFNGIFTKMYNKFTQASVDPITLTLPYMNYTFTVSPYYLYNAIYNIGWTPLYNLISLMWYYGISLYIVKDIYKYINQIKNGNISHTDTNIKTEML